MGLSNIPSNLIVWAVGSVVAALFASRAYLNYRKVKSPLSRYFAITGISASIAWALWSFPFIFIDIVSDRWLLTLLITTGDLMIIGTLLLQVRIYWYLALQDTTKFIYLGVPASIVALVGAVYLVKTALGHPELPMIINGEAVLPYHMIVGFCQIILIIFLILVGVELLKRAAKQSDRKSKFGSVAISLLYIATGLAGATNILSVNSGAVASPLAIAINAIGLASFTLIFIAFRIVEIWKR